ncbi:hypothetical protein D3C80_2016320 [compost metagenome]
MDTMFNDEYTPSHLLKSVSNIESVMVDTFDMSSILENAVMFVVVRAALSMYPSWILLSLV